MGYRIMGDPVTGNVAIYSCASPTSTDDEPLNDPYTIANLQRTQIHSAHIYPSTTAALTQAVMVTIPAQSADTKYSGQINLFAHGKGEPCMVEGRFLNLETSGNHVAINGSMPVNVTPTGHATWIALGSTSTHVVIVYSGITYAGFSAFNLTIEASAYDYLASGPAPTGNPALPLIDYAPGSSPPYLTFGRGKIDTRRRYIRKVDTNADFAMATGPTLSIIGSGDTGVTASGRGSWVQEELGWRWRYSCAGYTKQTLVGWNGAATNGGTYEAPHILVKR